LPTSHNLKNEIIKINRIYQEVCMRYTYEMTNAEL